MNTRDGHPEQLLPWYANETLSPEEKADVEQHLAQCEQCRNEVALLKRLREQVQKEEIPSPGEFGFKRLQRAVNQEQRVHSVPPAWWRPALAAAVVVILVQSALLVNLWPGPKPMTPLGVDHDGAVLQITFTPDSTIAQIQKLLERIQGTIIDGPGAIGVYRVRLAMDPVDEREIDRIVTRLRQERQIVTHVSKE